MRYKIHNERICPRVALVKIRIFGLCLGLLMMVLTFPAGAVLSLEERMEQMEARMQEMELKLEATQLENKRLKQALIDGHYSLEMDVAAVAKDTEKVAELKDKIASLELKIDKNKKDTAEALKSLPNMEIKDVGVTFKTPDDNYKLNLSGYLQADGRFFFNNETGSALISPPNDQFLIRRARLNLSGSLFNAIDFRFAPDFAGSAVRLFDAFADLHYFDFAAIQVGKMRSPVSLERYQLASNLTFMERAYPSQISPNRDVGVMLHGQFAYPGYKVQYSPQPVFTDFFSYEVGVFNGVRDNQLVQNSDTDKDNNKEVAARVFSHPLLHSGKAWLEGLGVGVSGTWGQPSGNNLPNLLSVGQNNIVTYTGGFINTLASGESYRVYPQMYWFYGPFHVLGEYVYSFQNLVGSYTQSGNTKTAQVGAGNSAWQVQTGYMLTGEKSTFFRVKPDKNFNPFAGTWGALQLIARYTELDIDRDIYHNYGTVNAPIFVFSDPRQSVSNAATWSLGLNWFLNPNLKIAANYDQTSFKGGGGSVSNYLSRDLEKVFMTRLQVQF